MSIMQSMRSFIASCPHMDRFTGDGIDLTSPEPGTYGIIGNGDTVIQRYRGGTTKRQFDCMLTARDWTTEDVDRLENSGFLEDFIFWAEDKNRRRERPVLDAGMTAMSVSAGNGMLAYYREELQLEINGYINSREVFEDITAHLDMRGFTDIQRAAMFYIKIKISYGADGRTFGCNKKSLNSDYLTDIEERLNSNGGVVIEHKDFENLIKVYDRPGSLFYLDPPYHKTEKYYDAAFTEDDHYRLKQCLNAIKGSFILSYNDDDFVRELYKDFNILAVERSNSLSKGKYKEVIITNY